MIATVLDEMVTHPPQKKIKRKKKTGNWELDFNFHFWKNGMKQKGENGVWDKNGEKRIMLTKVGVQERVDDERRITEGKILFFYLFEIQLLKFVLYFHLHH